MLFVRDERAPSVAPSLRNFRSIEPRQPGGRGVRKADPEASEHVMGTVILPQLEADIELRRWKRLGETEHRDMGLTLTRPHNPRTAVSVSKRPLLEGGIGSRLAHEEPHPAQHEASVLRAPRPECR